MVKYKDLSDDEREKVLDKAMKWYNNHEEHVDTMIEEILGKQMKGVPPSGSDLYNPELWKDIHWKWFFLGDGR